nr:uncharacterized protein LOC127491610 isoform X1 [Oryctolagus cuniculus]
MGSNQGSRTEAKPLPRGGPGRASRLLGGTVAVVLILGVALAVLFVCRRQKSRLGTLGDQTDLPPSQKLEPSPDRQSGHAPDGSQVLHLESGRRRQQQQEEEDEGEALQKLSLQPPYYDLGFSPAHHPLVRTTEPRGQGPQTGPRAREGTRILEAERRGKGRPRSPSWLYHCRCPGPDTRQTSGRMGFPLRLSPVPPSFPSPRPRPPLVPCTPVLPTSTRMPAAAPPPGPTPSH